MGQFQAEGTGLVFGKSVNKYSTWAKLVLWVFSFHPLPYIFRRLVNCKNLISFGHMTKKITLKGTGQSFSEVVLKNNPYIFPSNYSRRLVYWYFILHCFSIDFLNDAQFKKIFIPEHSIPKFWTWLNFVLKPSSLIYRVSYKMSAKM